MDICRRPLFSSPQESGTRIWGLRKVAGIISVMAIRPIEVSDLPAMKELLGPSRFGYCLLRADFLVPTSQAYPKPGGQAKVTSWPLFRQRSDRILATGVAGGLFLLGVAELLFRLDDPASLFFWLPTLWGGSALVAVGAFRRHEPIGQSLVMVIVGGLLGLLPSIWTILMPLLIVALVVRAVLVSSRVPKSV